MMTSSSGWPARKRGVWSARAALACGALLLGSAVHEAGSSLPAPVLRHTPSLSLPRALPRPSKLRRPLSSLPQSIQPAHVYRIRWGDSLWSLAQRFHISIAALESANDLKGTTIYAGDILTIPTAHTVIPGESVESIARQHKVPVLTLWHANHLVSDKLAGGQTLTIPAADASASVFDAHATPANGPGGAPSTVPFTHEDIRLLAHLVHAEAGNQPFLGQVGVAAVVLNRLKSPGFPKTIPEVIEEPGQFDSVITGSFWQSPGSLAYKAVMAALKGADPTGGALFYYNPSLPYANWMNTLPVTATIGSQVFCR